MFRLVSHQYEKLFKKKKKKTCLKWAESQSKPGAQKQVTHSCLVTWFNIPQHPSDPRTHYVFLMRERPGSHTFFMTERNTF